MKHPAYHLRTNKAVDRFLLIEVLNKLQNVVDISKYTYYGFGGPYLEDLRLLNMYFPLIKLVSLENDYNTYLRQKFHLFNNNIKLVNKMSRSFITTYPVKNNEIFWLDYTKLSYEHIDEFMTLLNRVEVNSIIKLTLPVKLKEELKNTDQAAIEEFRSEYGGILPSLNIENSLLTQRRFIDLVMQMIHIASDKILPSGVGVKFQILNGSHYSDGTNMLSVIGIKCNNDDVDRFTAPFDSWKFKSLVWDKIHRIDLPELSIKERLKLESKLPLESNAGKTLLNLLEYLIDNKKSDTIAKLQQYSDFHRYYPLFAKVLF